MKVKLLELNSKYDTHIKFLFKFYFFQQKVLVFIMLLYAPPIVECQHGLISYPWLLSQAFALYPVGIKLFL